MASQSFLDCSDAAGLVTSMSGQGSQYSNATSRLKQGFPTVNTKVVKGPRDLDLGLCVEVGICELLAFS